MEERFDGKFHFQVRKAFSRSAWLGYWIVFLQRGVGLSGSENAGNIAGVGGNGLSLKYWELPLVQDRAGAPSEYVALFEGHTIRLRGNCG